MTFEIRTKQIHAYFADNFTGVDPEYIAWPNARFVKPTDGTAWIRVDSLETVTDFTSIGRSARTRRQGNFTVQIFTEVDAGTLQAEQIADEVRSTLEGRATIEAVYFKECSKTRLGQFDGWYSVLCTIPFYFDDILDLT